MESAAEQFLKKLEYMKNKYAKKMLLTKKSEAEYEYTLKQIDRKEKKIDNELAKLETERNALTTMYDSVKKVIEDNVERTFGIFS